jgi:hypothetical protein
MQALRISQFVIAVSLQARWSIPGVYMHSGITDIRRPAKHREDRHCHR